MSLQEAVKVGDIETLCELLKSVDIDVNAADNKGTPLTIACGEGSEAIVRILLRHPSISPHETDHDHSPPLDHVGETGIILAKLLLEHPRFVVTTDLFCL